MTTEQHADDIHSCGPTCSRAGCVEVRQDAHHYV